MNELIYTRQSKKTTLRSLLATTSLVAIVSATYPLSQARAEDSSERPTVWIEIGGQLSRLADGQEAFAQSFPVPRPAMFSPSQIFERPPLYSIDGEGKLAFEPSGSDWIFSASVRYGRSTAQRDVRQQTYPKGHKVYGTRSGESYVAKYQHAKANKFADTTARNTESHAVFDFQAGKDVGLGIFGSNISSTLNFGVRFAQFTGKSNIAIKSDPDWHFTYKYVVGKKIAFGQPYHSNQANLQAFRSFHGVGPSMSWNGSAPVAHTAQDSELALDWSFNAAVLFGRQRAKIHHDAQAQYLAPGIHSCYGCQVITYDPQPANLARSRTIAVPNVGGFAGLSFRYANAKISAGYRADIFLGAMDGGIDTRKTYDRDFYGPFAAISIGLGG